jgi:two-component system, chemotaxis family, sensor kinase CheA
MILPQPELDSLVAEFVAETREALERAQDLLVSWENNPSDASAGVDEVFRFVHTVKGSCGFLDLPLIATLAHAAESTLSEVRAGSIIVTAPLAATLLAIVDRIAARVGALETGAAEPQGASDEALIDALATGAPLAPSGIQVEAPQSMMRTVRLSVDRLEELMAQVSDLVLARNELSRQLRDTDADQATNLVFERLSYAIGDVRETVAKTRLQPIDRLFATLPRMVRDTAKACGKDVRLVIEGSDVEIDREMVEAIRDPLTHIIRNAIDHGIEPVEQRQLSGKSIQGTLRVIAQQSGNQVSITVHDDGRGIDVQRLVNRAVSAGVLDASQASGLQAERALDLIFSPGLSTADQVTEISGRGVGMDVVRANIEKIGGSIGLDNRPGRGLAITLRAPLTLSIINALLVRVGVHQFGIPRGVIEEIVAVGSASLRLERIGGGYVAILRNEMLPVINLHTQLRVGDAEPNQLIVITTADGYRFAAGFDTVLDHEELVVRPTAPQLAMLEIYAGQSLSDSGKPLLILDPSGLARDAGIESRRDFAEAVAPIAIASEQRVVVFDALDGTRKALRSADVERIDDVSADAVARVSDRLFVVMGDSLVHGFADGPIPEGVPLVGLRLKNAKGQTVYWLAKQVIDLVPLVNVSATDDEEMAGVCLIDGHVVQLIDWPIAISNERKAIVRQAA